MTEKQEWNEARRKRHEQTVFELAYQVNVLKSFGVVPGAITAPDSNTAIARPTTPESVSPSVYFDALREAHLKKFVHAPGSLDVCQFCGDLSRKGA